MNVGKMDRRINFLKQKNTRDAYGDVSHKWVAAKVGIWASKEPILGNEYFAAFTTETKVTAKFRTRYISGITNDMRIMDGKDMFEILDAIDVKSEGKILLCYCKAVS